MPLKATDRIERTWNLYDLIGFLKALPWSKAPGVVVLNDAGSHTSRAMRAARKDLAERRIYLDYLQPYSPELDRIEPASRQVKHQEVPQRSYEARAGCERPSRWASPATAGSSEGKVEENYLQLLRPVHAAGTSEMPTPP